jgi:hypothetical protein
MRTYTVYLRLPTRDSLLSSRASLRRVTAIDGEDLTRNESGLVGCKKKGCLRDIDWLADAG